MCGQRVINLTKGVPAPISCLIYFQCSGYFQRGYRKRSHSRYGNTQTAMTSPDSVKRRLFVSQAITPLKGLVRPYILGGCSRRFDCVRGFIILFNFGDNSRIIFMMSLFFLFFALFFVYFVFLFFFCISFSLFLF